MNKRLPPYAKPYLADPPSVGLCVAIGPGAWNYAKQKPFPLLVLPEKNQPSDFRWPFHKGGAVLFERGEFNDERLEAMALELLIAGSPYVIAIREAMMGTDPRHFFYPEVEDVAA